MKFLIDMNLPPEWVNVFEQHGWHAVHWQEVGDPRASDKSIMAWARQNGYVVFKCIAFSHLAKSILLKFVQ